MKLAVQLVLPATVQLMLSGVSTTIAFSPGYIIPTSLTPFWMLTYVHTVTMPPHEQVTIRLTIQLMLTALTSLSLHSIERDTDCGRGGTRLYRRAKKHIFLLKSVRKILYEQCAAQYRCAGCVTYRPRCDRIGKVFFHLYHHLSCTLFWMLRDPSLLPQSKVKPRSKLYNRPLDTGNTSAAANRESRRTAESGSRAATIERQSPQNPTCSVCTKQPKRRACPNVERGTGLPRGVV